MRNESLFYLEWLRAALWNTSGPASLPSEHFSWSSVLRLIQTQATGSLVFPALLASQLDFPQPLKQQMKMHCVQTMQQQVKLQQTLMTSWQALEQAHIRAVLMKGAGLASLYREPYLREWSDVDLFVGKEQYHHTCQVLRETFPNALKFDEELDHYKHYNLIADGVSIEIHRVSMSMTHPCDRKHFEQMEKRGMDPINTEELSISGLPVRLPEKTFNILFVFLHSWEHMMTRGANMRQLCDLALLLHHHAGQVQVHQLKRDLHTLHLMEVWRAYMYLLVNYLGLPPHEAPFYVQARDARAERMVTDLMQGRMQAPETDRPAPKNKIARKIFTMRLRWRNCRRIARYCPAYAKHMKAAVWLQGLSRLFAADRHWE